MSIKQLNTRQSLNKAFLKVKPNRTDIETFKTNLISLLDNINDTESEEHHKNLISDFLKDTYYKQNHFINTKGRNDLVIHNAANADTMVGVILEVKKPTNKAEMIKPFSIDDSQEQRISKLNVKAFQELVLYYLRERITANNIEVKHLVATNINEWYIFDATTFDRLFAQNKTFLKQFLDFEARTLVGEKTDFFYKQIAEPYINAITTDIEFTYFNIQDYKKVLYNNDKADDKELIALLKIFSPEHLLKLPFTNDSNSLDKRFYSELLHIIGLTETKEGSKKLIERNKDGERNSGTILEDSIVQLDSLDKLNRLEKPNQYGNTKEERLFNVALELSITWINRILFLKLLEAQLITYHKGDKAYSFLNLDKIKNFDDLNSLFFQVLARKYEERNADVKRDFEKVPYLNSSLFEPTELEQVTLFISNLRDDKTIPIISSTVLKDQQGKKRTGNLKPLDYLFAFLDAYDFSSEGSEEIQEENKTLINASVLGLIFEKINGYKDGSFFTPGFITMYMCRETIRKAVVQKFTQEFNNFTIETLSDIHDLIPNKISKKQANEIINSLKICDPAVGSGHFLVSALNEMIAIKNDLKILEDKEGKSLNRYEVEVVNDELIITDEDGEPFEYNYKSKESQRIQETLFHEKQIIIENCLFGVDINSNSVKICRLRLWIELLKNAYYKAPSPSERAGGEELETLPNIDINIKCGNSLVSRFAMDSDLKQALKKSKWTIDSYRLAVDTYRNAKDKEQKREMEKLIEDIKSDFTSEISLNNPKAVRLRKLSSELFSMTNQGQLFEMTNKEKADWDKKAQQLAEEIKKIETEIAEIKANKIYENAFEWRFEFPEVLNDDGDFVGFDVVIGNPPYIQLQSIKDVSEQLKQFNYKTHEKTGDIYSLFYEKGNNILKENGHLGYITSNKWMRAGYGKSTRNYLLQHTQPLLLVDLGSGIFEEATVDSNLLVFKKSKYTKSFNAFDISKEKYINDIRFYESKKLSISPNIDESWIISSNIEQSIKQKIEQKGKPLKDWDINIYRGILTGYNEAFIIDGKKKDELISQDPKSAEIIKPILRGRDIKRYKAEWADLWLISTFPALKIDIDCYPAVKSYLQSFGKRLNQTGDDFIDEQGQKATSRKKTGNKWFETQDQIGYYKEFEKEKIVWASVGQTYYTYAENSTLLLDTNYFAVFKTRVIDKYILGLLNSKLITKWVNYQDTAVGEIAYRHYKYNFEKIPILNLPEADKLHFVALVEQILSKKAQGEDTTALEAEIDKLVYELYGLTEEEIRIIEEG